MLKARPLLSLDLDYVHPRMLWRCHVGAEDGRYDPLEQIIIIHPHQNGQSSMHSIQILPLPIARSLSRGFVSFHWSPKPHVGGDLVEQTKKPISCWSWEAREEVKKRSVRSVRSPHCLHSLRLELLHESLSTWKRFLLTCQTDMNRQVRGANNNQARAL